MSGSVYVLRAENGHVKFGFSKMPERRIAGLRTANGVAFDVVCIVPATKAQENYIHQNLKPHRIRGEWYRDTAAVEEFIAIVSTGCLPHVEKGQKFEGPISEDMRDAIEAAGIIMKCGAVLGVTHYRDVAAHFGIPVRPLFKFVYRPTEPMMGEYLMLMHCAVEATNQAQRKLGELKAFAAGILDAHEAGVRRTAELAARLQALEAETAA